MRKLSVRPQPSRTKPRSGSPRRRSAGARRRGRAFTLIELLVAMTVSLIMVFALVRMFELIGHHAARERATLEMSGQLRGVALRLQQDLQGATAPARPWSQGDSGAGYFEYYEGISHDDDANADSVVDLQQSGFNTALGDLDDVLLFTMRNPGEPLVGQIEVPDPSDPNNTDPLIPSSTITQTIESPVAEVVWWMSFKGPFTDVASHGTLYRRVLLVRPDMASLLFNNSRGVIRTIPYTNDQTGLKKLGDDLVKFFIDNDLSVHVERRQSGNNLFVDLVANSLADLSRRENRFAHQTVVFEDPQGPTYYLAPNNQFPYPQFSFYPRFPYPLDVDSIRMTPSDPRSVTSLQQLALNGGVRMGENVILTDVAAFDVRAFDPGAVVAVDDSSNPTEALTPGDPAWRAVSTTPANQLAAGAYVDLNYAGRNLSTPFGTSLFSGPPAFDDVNNNGRRDSGERYLSGLTGTRATYDTWTMDYEHDGVNEDGDPVDLSSNGLDDDLNGQIDDPGEASMPRIDEGANGLDDDGRFGVDDIGERETAAPYPVPLRGIQVRIRVLEPDTRQVRQATVAAHFTPE